MESRIKTLNKRRSKGGLLSGAGLIVSLIGFALMLMLAVPTPEGAMADGGANDECEPADVSSSDQPAGDGEKTITSDQLPDGAVWENVCIKPGNNHSNELTQNGYYDFDSGSFTFVGTTEPVADGCYFLVSGIGTAGDLTVTQLAVGAGNACSGLGISHLEANWLSATDPTLVITKVCVDGTGESFGYDVDPDGSIADPSVDCGASSASIVLTADTFHSVTEDMPLPDGWTLTSVLCTGTTESQITDGVSFTPTFDDAIECTFTNTFEVDSGSIQICKDADGLVAGDEFDFNIDGPGINQNFDLEDGNCQLFDPLDLGEYVIIELDDDDLVDIDCDIVDNGPGGDEVVMHPAGHTKKCLIGRNNHPSSAETIPMAQGDQARKDLGNTATRGGRIEMNCFLICQPPGN